MPPAYPEHSRHRCRRWKSGRPRATRPTRGASLACLKSEDCGEAVFGDELERNCMRFWLFLNLFNSISISLVNSCGVLELLTLSFMAQKSLFFGEALVCCSSSLSVHLVTQCYPVVRTDVTGTIHIQLFLPHVKKQNGASQVKPPVSWAIGSGESITCSSKVTQSH